MSDQRRAGDVISLEEIFRSWEFGRRPTQSARSPVATVESTDPPLLEQVFLSELFGHPEALAATPTPSLLPTGPSVTGPTLVLLSGRGDAERDFTRARGAIGAVSGVAAAALVVAGMTSGTGSPSGQPTVSAEGHQPGHGSPPGGGGSLPEPGGVATSPSAPGPGRRPAARGNRRLSGRDPGRPARLCHDPRHRSARRRSAAAGTGLGRSLAARPGWRDGAVGHLAGWRRQRAHAGLRHRRQHRLDRRLDGDGGFERPRPRGAGGLAGDRIAQQRRGNGDESRPVRRRRVK